MIASTHIDTTFTIADLPAPPIFEPPTEPEDFDDEEPEVGYGDDDWSYGDEDDDAA